MVVRWRAEMVEGVCVCAVMGLCTFERLEILAASTSSAWSSAEYPATP